MVIGAARWRWRAPLGYDLASTRGPVTIEIVGSTTMDPIRDTTSDTERDQYYVSPPRHQDRSDLSL